jgi:citrate lyase subunit beta/citryl-CoA lyase
MAVNTSTAALVPHSALPLRSMLYAPATAERLLARIFDAGADAVILDLEDAVAASAKATARQRVALLLAERHTPSPGSPAARRSAAAVPLFVRVNGLRSGLTRDDLVAIIWPGLSGVKLPKVESADEVRQVGQWLSQLEPERGLRDGSVTIMASIESAAGVEYAAAIAAAADRVWCLSFGAADYALDTGAELTADGAESLYARSRLVVASRAAGRARPFDSVYPYLDDEAGLRVNAYASKRLGFQGKSVIHPRQLAVVHQVYSPSADEVERARRVQEAFVAAEAGGSAAIQLDGALIDYATYYRARQILSWVEQRDATADRAGGQGR